MIPMCIALGSVVVEKFVCERNIDAFVDRLRVTSDGIERQTLLRLLIKEEDKFARTSEYCSMLERHIAAGEALIQKQRHLIERFKQHGRIIQNAEFVLETLIATQELFVRQHRLLSRELAN
jgi:hypothetical protein